jgi:hypothetical protein
MNTYKVVEYSPEPIELGEAEKLNKLVNKTRVQMGYKTIKENLTWEDAKKLRKTNRNYVIVETHKPLKAEAKKDEVQ